MAWLSVEHIGSTELINLLLKAPVDLLYNGGIDTYVKASKGATTEASTPCASMLAKCAPK